MLKHVAILLLAGLSALAQETSRPNVLLICVDDLKPTLGCYGDVHAKTPNMDRLARHGVVFRSAYVNQAVCGPSRNALLTGLRPDQIGVYDLPTPFRTAVPDVVTLPQRFMAEGYFAESLGKVYHIGAGNSGDAASWSVPAWEPRGPHAEPVTAGGPAMPPGATDRPGLRPGLSQPFGPAWSWPAAPDEAFKDGKLAQQAVARLDALADGQAPFFLAVGFFLPHLPFYAPQKYWDLFDPKTLPVHPADAGLPTDAPDFAGSKWGELRAYSDIQETGPLTSEQARTMVHGYYASVAFADAQLGKVLDVLDRRKLWDRTIVVLWGDHGWHLGDHGLWCKHTNFEQATHNPVIICAPGKSRGEQTGALIETVDLYPTLCALAGIAPAQGLPGKVLTPILDDPTASVQDAVFHLFPRQVGNEAGLGRAVRTQRHRYVEWRAWSDNRLVAQELYDYQLDPAEARNIAGHPENAALVKRLSARLSTLGPAKPQVVAGTAIGQDPAGKSAKDKKWRTPDF